MKKIIKIAAGIIAIALISTLLLIANGFLGNPVSKALAERAASKHIEKTYPDLNLQLEKVNYSFKTGGYYALIKSPTSIDIHFNVDISPAGKVLRDSYETDVLSGWNTYQRIDSEYRIMTDKIFEAPDYPYISHIDFGSLKMKEVDKEIGSPGPDYGISMEDLELDKKYDVKELAKTAGHITVYIQKEEVTVEKASEVLLNLKEIFDIADVPFYAIDFVLQKPRGDDGTPNEDKTELRVNDFLYSDIYEKDLEDRFMESAKVLEEYYKKKDAERQRMRLDKVRK
ncbi:MAG: hypothetical protein WBI21_08500 [Natronincolaceae bacterium]|jgi:hypothetical protein|nr:hypothetical protein [Bacillota bacterium]